MTSTYFALLAEFNTAEIPLRLCCVKFFGLEEKKASERARRQQLPVPAYRGGSQKSEWLIDAVELAKYIDTKKEAAKLDWERINGRAG